MTTIAIVYFSGYGHTVKQAEAVRDGAGSVAGATATLYAIDKDGNVPDGTFEALVKADAVIYGSPTYMGNAAWQFKKFADATSKLWFKQELKDKVAGGFTNSASTNGDKGVTMNYLWTLSQQHGQIWVGTGLLPSNLKASTSDDVNWQGAFGGAFATSPADSSPEEGPRKGDLETAKIYGARVAQIAKKLK